MSSLSGLRERAGRIRPPEDGELVGLGASGQYVPRFPRVPGVVRNTFENEGKIEWQRIGYKRPHRPSVGQYKAFGPRETGYPLETLTPSDYDAFIWQEEEITEEVSPIMAVFRGGAWIIEPINLDALEPVVIVSTPSDTSEFLYIRRWEKGTGNQSLIWGPRGGDPELVETWFKHVGLHYKPMIGLNPPLVAAMIKIGWTSRVLPNGACIRFFPTTATQDYEDSDCPRVR